MNAWNKRNIPIPPSITVDYTVKDRYDNNLDKFIKTVAECLRSFGGIVKSKTTEKCWISESNLMTALLYQNGILRMEKYYKIVKKVNKCLRRWKELDLLRYVSVIQEMLPTSVPPYGTVWLPSRQMFEYLVLRVIGGFHILLCIERYCREAALCLLIKIKTGHLFSRCSLFLSCVARLRVLALDLAVQLAYFYDDISPKLKTLKGTSESTLIATDSCPRSLKYELQKLHSSLKEEMNKPRKESKEGYEIFKLLGIFRNKNSIENALKTLEVPVRRETKTKSFSKLLFEDKEESNEISFGTINGKDKDICSVENEEHTNPPEDEEDIGMAVDEDIGMPVDEEDKGSLANKEDKSLHIDEEDEDSLVDKKDKGSLADEKDEDSLADEEEGSVVDEEDNGLLIDEEGEDGKENDSFSDGENGSLADEEEKGLLVDEEDKGSLSDVKDTKSLTDEEDDCLIIDEEDKGSHMDEENKSSLSDEEDNGSLAYKEARILPRANFKEKKGHKFTKKRKVDCENLNTAKKLKKESTLVKKKKAQNDEVFNTNDKKVNKKVKNFKIQTKENREVLRKKRKQVPDNENSNINEIPSSQSKAKIKKLKKKKKLAQDRENLNANNITMCETTDILSKKKKQCPDNESRNSKKNVNTDVSDKKGKQSLGIAKKKIGGESNADILLNKKKRKRNRKKKSNS